MKPSSYQLAAILAVLVLVLAGAKLEAWWQRTRVRTRKRAIARRGIKGERDAEKLLRQLGYTLVLRHTPGSYGVLLDGEPLEVQLKADYLVELDGRQFVAEVKTGKAVTLDHADTRRQMLEYQLAFGVDALLLVDMESKQVRTVQFPLPTRTSPEVLVARRRTYRWAAVAVLSLLALWLLTQRSP